MAAHAEPVNIRARNVLYHEGRFPLERLKVFHGAFVHLVGVNIGADGQIDLRTRDVKKAD